MEVLLNSNERGYLVSKLGAKDQQDALYSMADKLLEEGYVKDTYKAAVWEREQNFPTGLPTEGICIAIPHTDSIHVEKEGMMLSILDNPVKFNVMGGMSDEKIDVELVFMLAVKNKEDQLEKLQKLVAMFQDPSKLKVLKAAEDMGEITSIMEELK